VSQGARYSESFRRGSPPAEADLGESRYSGRRMEVSSVFPSARCRHVSPCRSGRFEISLPDSESGLILRPSVSKTNRITYSLLNDLPAFLIDRLEIESKNTACRMLRTVPTGLVRYVIMPSSQTWEKDGNQPEGWSRRALLQTHFEQNHKDYLVWKKSRKRLVRILGTASVILVTVIISIFLFTFNIHLPPGRSSGAIFILPILLAFFFPSTMINRWGIRKFKREWIARGGFPAPSFTQS
jgi:hypothetical protein